MSRVDKRDFSRDFPGVLTLPSIGCRQVGAAAGCALVGMAQQQRDTQLQKHGREHRKILLVALGWAWQRWLLLPSAPNCEASWCLLGAGRRRRFLLRLLGY